MNVAVPDRWVVSSSHLCGQINSKHHGQAFRHLAKGRRDSLGSARVA